MWEYNSCHSLDTRHSPALCCARQSTSQEIFIWSIYECWSASSCWNNSAKKAEMGGWWKSCSALNVILFQETSPSKTSSLFSSVSFGSASWGCKVSPKMQLYGFSATDPLLPAWKSESYHLTTWTIWSLGSFWSQILRGRSGCAKSSHIFLEGGFSQE